MRKIGFVGVNIALATMLIVSGCGSDTSNSASSTTGTTDTADTNANTSEDNGGLKWDASTNEYEMEPEIASGEQALKIWVEYEDYGKALVEAFKVKYPQVKVEYEIVAKVESVERMALDGEAGKGADVFTANYDKLAQAIDNATAAPLGNYGDTLKERVPDTFVEVASKDGQLYGVPISTESIALFYNKTLLKELTGSDQPATTWEEIIELANKYNDSSKNQWTIRFLAGQLYYAYPVLSSMGWHLYEDKDLDKPNFSSESLTKGLEYYKSLRSVWNVNSADATWDSIESEFVKGKTPYVITGPWVFKDFDAAAADNKFEYGVTTLPKAASGDVAGSLTGISVAVVSGYSKYPAAARVFANFMASDEGAAALYKSIGAIPALKSDHIQNVEGINGNEHIKGIIAQSENADLTPQIPDYLYTAGNSLIVNVWDNLMAVGDAQQKADKEYADLKSLGK
ncbi:carbohydrate ABC transporter substrate-binding protein (CUT1 family) [Paenibacillus cellulosilyticus]|uniref:Carbohydrate ABC transporter substrate-binding protein (CUT1 family) n=1 Tax=Paenibacillus cellulosilyticus TaxID=375489 RepID=A0A2V2YXR7_9BACL|nr:extracellular solute-binding protein [Paenibacillus cellulosilyticus]PWW05090.1 carbohydrate ABC transporter substrate-binding protein (CUT1 family) [Paenibacillus cellulosilyticus]QKS48642.1 extracellular solute-binding protein [Paenibacillus cellulosilyticus]